MKTIESKGVRFGINTTIIIIGGYRAGLKTVETLSVIDETRKILSGKTKDFGVDHLINTPKAFSRALILFMRYWNDKGSLTNKAYKDIKKMAYCYEDMKDIIIEGLQNHRHLLSMEYDTLPGLKICKDKITIRIPNSKDYRIRCSFKHTKNSYFTHLTITDTKKTVTLIRHRILRNVNGFLRQLDDWNERMPKTANNQVLFDSYKDIRHYLLENKDKLNLLINDLNEQRGL